jgi:hypothetical protein
MRVIRAKGVYTERTYGIDRRQCHRCINEGEYYVMIYNRPDCRGSCTLDLVLCSLHYPRAFLCFEDAKIKQIRQWGTSIMRCLLCQVPYTSTAVYRPRTSTTVRRIDYTLIIPSSTTIYYPDNWMGREIVIKTSSKTVFSSYLCYGHLSPLLSPSNVIKYIKGELNRWLQCAQ